METRHQATRKLMSHRPALDGLRCLALLAVFFFHATGNQDGPFFFGSDGVYLFFVLSGFLITRILLIAETGDVWQDIKTFYIRRTLRIFPLYYATLLLLYIGGKLPDAAWFATYTYNIRLFFDPNAGGPSHFWTLCVEEQFYLTFPLLLYAIPKAKRMPAMAVMLVFSIVLRVALPVIYPNYSAGALMPVSGAYLLMGCIAGYVELRRPEWTPPGARLVGFGFALYVVLVAVAQVVDVGAFNSLLRVARGIPFTAMVFGIWRLPEGWLQDAFSARIPVYLGRISYGLYVFHPFALAASNKILAKFSIQSLPLHLILGFTLTLGVSALSWHLFESPINNLKKYFDYKRPSLPVRPAQPAPLAVDAE